jgi:hypothetical protein
MNDMMKMFDSREGFRRGVESGLDAEDEKK